MLKKAVCLLLALLITLPAMGLSEIVAFAQTGDAATQQAQAADNVVENQTVSYSEKSFLTFMSEHENDSYPSNEAPALTKDQPRVTLNDGDSYSVTFTASEAGLYAVRLTYKNIAGRGTMPIFKMIINGEYQFSESESIKLKRQFKEINTGKRDASGNEIVPETEEIFADTTVIVEDIAGKYGGVLYFYLNAGENTLRIDMDNEAVEISEIVFTQPEKLSSYSEVSSSFKYSAYDGEALYFEAENTYTKSDTTIIRANDSTSPAITPYDIQVKNLNVIGGSTWNTPGQYMEWEIEVPKDALYSITVKGRQNASIGVSSFRTLYVDGKVPYSEFEEIAFAYDTSFNNFTLTVDGKPALLELSAGKHIIRMEVALGEYKTLLSDINDTAEALSTAYRKIIMLTTADPDSYRDYKIATNLPDVIETFEIEKKNLEEMYNTIMTTMSGASSGTRVLDTLATQLSEFLDDPYRITSRLSKFKTNITSLTTWLQSATSQPLQLDYIVLSAPDGEIKPANAGFFATLKHEVLSFINTFSDDYLNFVDSDDSITVWVSGGQVQMNALKELVENEYNPYHDIKVNLKLVTASLLMAIVSGKGPDIALGINDTSVMNYAFRDAVVDISRFDDLDEVLTRFRDSTKIQVTFEGKMYGIPESQSFSMLYYRTDILDELNITVPDTWDQVISVMSALKKKNLEMGIPTGMFTTKLYQNGGQMYNDDLTATQLTTLESISAFSFVCSLFTDYSVPKSYDTDNRFRTGEMPIVLAAYTLCNTLSLSAPEIQGKWRMAKMPATVREDGTIDRSVSSDTGYSIILNEEKADACWEFLKWKTSDEITLKYANKVEQILGVSARSTTANINAFNQLPWDPDDLQMINEQAEWLVAVPAVPGNYYTSRHLSNAMNKVFYSSGVPAEEIKSFAKVIDEEITSKREELGFN